MNASSQLHSQNGSIGRITESRTDPDWGRPAGPIKNPDWFERHAYTAGQLSLGHKTDREFYVYDATSLVIKGHCCYETLSGPLAMEGLIPIRTSDGRAFVSIWINSLRDSVCGAYHEIAISIDATLAGENCQTKIPSNGNPFRHLYNNFGETACQCQFMHSLYINSPVSIAWGREMQAFPKHIEPVYSTIEDGDDEFNARVRWHDDLVMNATVRKPPGLGRFAKQLVGLVSGVRPMRLLKFMASTQLDMPIQMPKQTASQHGLPSNYLAQLRKGLDPNAVQCWPWTDRDTLELGDVVKETGCEANNGHDLIRKAQFMPTIVTYFPFMQGYIAES